MRKTQINSKAYSARHRTHGRSLRLPTQERSGAKALGHSAQNDGPPGGYAFRYSLQPSRSKAIAGVAIPTQ